MAGQIARRGGLIDRHLQILDLRLVDRQVRYYRAARQRRLDTRFIVGRAFGLEGEGGVGGAERVRYEAARLRPAAIGRIEHHLPRDVILQCDRGIDIAFADRTLGARNRTDRERTIDEVRGEAAVLARVRITQAADRPEGVGDVQRALAEQLGRASCRESVCQYV